MRISDWSSDVCSSDLFRDITTLIHDADGFRKSIDRLADAAARHGPTLVAGIEARGFIFGSGVAHRLGLGFVPVRKSKKLPGAVIGVDYTLEYGLDRLEIHDDRSEEHTSELQSLMRISYAVFCLKTKKQT